MGVPEARLEDAGSGLAPVSPGWFSVNVRDAAWIANEAFGARCLFEAATPDVEARRFEHLGMKLAGTHHGFVGAGDGPCVLLMVGARFPERTIDYPSQGASSSQEAYAGQPDWRPGPCPDVFG